MKQIYRVALAGNPNCGKTTVFNLLTGARQHIGNYSGVTVERKTGRCRIEDIELEIIDLPGIYSLSSSSPEEKIAFDEILNNNIDLILNIIDAGNPQRNLYLTTQLAELNIPMLMVFNMIDDAERNGLAFDFSKIESFFGTQVITTVGTTGKGIQELKNKIFELVKYPHVSEPCRLKYGESADSAIADLSEKIDKLGLALTKRLPPRYFAIKMLENDETICSISELESLRTEILPIQERLTQRHGISAETFMADRRYGFISGVCREAIHISNERRRQFSDNIDKVMTNRWLGIPVFLIIMYLVFQFTFIVAEPMMGWIETFFGLVSWSIEEVWPTDTMPLLRAMVSEGIIGGVGGVLVFLPNILLLFLAIAFLEGTGYMSRAAFVMDGFMRIFGLHGKSFIPMLLGFGCTVPAVMATRTIESERDRLTTIMVLPLMSCGARLPIYALIIPAFFVNQYRALIMLIIYLIGIIMAMLGAMLLKSTLFKGEDEVFVLELPPYRMPTLRSIIIHMGERCLLYLKKAGTLILAASVIMFLINTFPAKTEFSVDYNAEIAKIEKTPGISSEIKSTRIAELETGRRKESLEYSLAGRIGRSMNVVMAPLGFDWRINSALVGAFAAKELFVSQLGILYAVSDADEESSPLRMHLVSNYSPLQAFTIMLFCLLSIPCIATVAVVLRETRSWLLTIGQMIGLIVLAYLVSLIVYQGGLFFNIGTEMVNVINGA
ncbi:MAG: ferrous iron transport protein B [Victivallaceae bacterium]|nr:ferrous iron transport protein B [Victivallaceae bacterium]